ncbi:MAG TPA: SNF2-related protein, partial [Nodosilinea sp.]|nr:SNF2-related protein [Nodosilinea sp.]
ELLRSSKIEARLSNQSRPLHAKIFRGDDAITLGSSNFSQSGLELQHEANSRFQREAEPDRYQEACQMAESYWELGRDYQAELIELLELLLSVVTWQEALVRACAELLEGDWAIRYTQGLQYSDEAALWPSQYQGIAHALWVIENVGSVLVADATGSGKTKTGANLIRSVMQKMWSTGRIKTEIPILLCPPSVEASWQAESHRCGENTLTCSHGLLSNTTEDKREDVLRLIRRAQVLAVDEAHRFLNLKSARTRQLFNNIADHVLLFTATPINRGPLDLIAIVDLLGADNFDDDLLDTLSRIRRRRGEDIAQAEIEKIQRAIQRFTVRRTKTMLNRMIEGNPEAFRNKHGVPCRYPKHVTDVYICDRNTATANQDRQLAAQIRETAAQLKGLQYVQKPIGVPDFYGGTHEQYLENRLSSAAALAMYYVMASLRSSRVRLIELIRGTEYAKTWGKISTRVKAQETGNVISSLQEKAGKPAQRVMLIHGVFLRWWFALSSRIRPSFFHLHTPEINITHIHLQRGEAFCWHTVKLHKGE